MLPNAPYVFTKENGSNEVFITCRDDSIFATTGTLRETMSAANPTDTTIRQVAFHRTHKLGPSARFVRRCCRENTDPMKVVPCADRSRCSSATCSQVDLLNRMESVLSSKQNKHGAIVR